MVDREIIQGKIQFIERALLKLEVLRQATPEDFLGNFRYVDSAKHNLQVAIEAVVDIANHIVARERFGLPDSSAEAISLLNERGILDADLAQHLRLMVKFRNRIVHLYQEVDDTQIYKILQEDLGDIRAFVAAIVTKFFI